MVRNMTPSQHPSLRRKTETKACWERHLTLNVALCAYLPRPEELEHSDGWRVGRRAKAELPFSLPQGSILW